MVTYQRGPGFVTLVVDVTVGGISGGFLLQSAQPPSRVRSVDSIAEMSELRLRSHVTSHSRTEMPLAGFAPGLPGSGVQTLTAL